MGEAMKPHEYYLKKHYAASDSLVPSRIWEIVGDYPDIHSNTIMAGKSDYELKNGKIYNTKPLNEYVFDYKNGHISLRYQRKRRLAYHCRITGHLFYRQVTDFPTNNDRGKENRRKIEIDSRKRGVGNKKVRKPRRNRKKMSKNSNASNNNQIKSEILPPPRENDSDKVIQYEHNLSGLVDNDSKFVNSSNLNHNKRNLNIHDVFKPIETNSNSQSVRKLPYNIPTNVQDDKSIVLRVEREVPSMNKPSKNYHDQSIRKHLYHIPRQTPNNGLNGQDDTSMNYHDESVRKQAYNKRTNTHDIESNINERAQSVIRKQYYNIPRQITTNDQVDQIDPNDDKSSKLWITNEAQSTKKQTPNARNKLSVYSIDNSLSKTTSYGYGRSVENSSSFRHHQISIQTPREQSGNVGRCTKRKIIFRIFFPIVLLIILIIILSIYVF